MNKLLKFVSVKKTYVLLIAFLPFTSVFAQVEGTWKVAPTAEALAVGPALNDFSWWSNTAEDVTARDCFFDDEFVFNEDGSFQNVLDSSTWLEQWQGVDPPKCDVPIAPHDGSNAATWTYDEAAGTITIDGTGAYLGLSKVVNGAELASPSDAPASITYPVVFSEDGKTMTIDIDFGGGFWHFVLERQETASAQTLQKQLFTVFPNPAREKIQINSDEFNDELILREITGKVILRVKAPSQREILDVSGLTSGLYLLEARSQGTKTIEKILIE